MKISNEQHFSSLMVKAQSADQLAYQQLLEGLSMFLANYLKTKIFVPTAIEDVSQEILLAIHKSRHTYDPKRPFMKWFLTLTHYKIIDYIRVNSKTSKREIMISDEFILHNDPSLMLIEIENMSLLIAAINRLDIKSRSVIELHKLEGLKVSEVAHKLNLSESNVRVIAHRAYKQLAKILTKLQGDNDK